MEDFKIKISIINPDYDAEYEKEWGFLNREYENSKYTSTNTFGIKNIKEYSYKDNVSFLIPYKEKEEDIELKECELKNVNVLEIKSNDNSISNIIISKSLISSTREFNRTKTESGYFYFYLNPNLDYKKIGDYIYITECEYPSELLTEESE